MISVDSYSPSLQKTAQEVLDTLDRMDSRMDQHYSRLRSHPRNNFRGVVHLCIPDPDSPVIKPGSGLSTRVWARCISSSGLSFICPDELDAKALLVGIEIPGRDTTWFQAEIKRERLMPDETFWEYGVAFINRVSV
ncbi:MAG: hypothetical protein KDA74_02715 [Planctomycetaceae bacterium]|nr:hypothetical protein [Planctomycetaceae bacterium]MCA9116236.1 hypothetical protein [Planctomycetaceae bacterium]